MATSIKPVLMRALFTKAQARTELADRMISVGFQVASDPNPNVLMLLVDDPESGVAARSADADQEMATTGLPRSRSETGTVTAAALSWNGGSSNEDQLDVIDAAFATIAAVESMLRDEPSLGITGYKYVVVQYGRDEATTNKYVASETTAGGCDCLVVATINFETRL